MLGFRLTPVICVNSQFITWLEILRKTVKNEK